MKIRKLIIGSLAAAAMGAAAMGAEARTNVDVYVNVGPPPAPPYEVVPAPRAGWVWVPGYWDWRGHHHRWVAGHWVRSRAGYAYYAPRWYEREGRWYVAQGGWRRHDADGDGVPNRYDRAPNNPYRF